MMNKLIELKNLTKNFDDQQVCAASIWIFTKRNS